MSFETHRPARFPQTDGEYVGGTAISYGGGNQTLDPVARAILVTTAGTLVVDTVDDSNLTLSGLLAGHVYKVIVKKIYQSGSNAAGVALR